MSARRDHLHEVVERLLRRGSIEQSIRSLAPVGEPTHRYLLVQQYADAGRGIQFAMTIGDDAERLVRAAHREVWDGWLPTELFDLDDGSGRDVEIGFALGAVTT